MSDPSTPRRYREYLRGFGIAESGKRTAELRDLDLGPVRFFAYAGGEGLRLKAAVTPTGLVTPGGNAGDDWYGFLSAMPDPAAAADRIAWLETDASTTAHGLPTAPVAVLTPGVPPAVGIDPEQSSLVTAPELHTGSGGRLMLSAWFLPSGHSRPIRWTVTARRDAPATLARVSAFELLAARDGDAAPELAAARARRLLATGSDGERLWALRHIGETGDPEAVSATGTLLAEKAASPGVRLLAAATLARLAEPAATAPLGAALMADTAPEVRRACAQALGRLGGPGAARALTEAMPGEPDATVRAEITHALALPATRR